MKTNIKFEITHDQLLTSNRKLDNLLHSLRSVPDKPISKEILSNISDQIIKSSSLLSLLNDQLRVKINIQNRQKEKLGEK
ncbi:MAG: hypothetical protein AABY32_04175 [Nanoarchaeota archaeon]